MRNFRTFVPAAVLFLILCPAAPPECGEYTRVERVIDGDTVQIEGGARVRYIGIDTPEMRFRNGTRWIYSPQPFGVQAKALNEALVLGKRVRLEFDVVKRDRYGRLLAYVYAGDIFVNRRIILEGYAMLMTIPPNVKHVDEFREALEQARKSRRGMWKNSS